MLFNSFDFVGLLLITFLLYYIPLLKKLQVQVLILASIVFYASYQPLLVLLLLFSVAINIFTSYKVVYGRAGLSRFYATLGVILNLSVLIFFKYSPLLAKTFLNGDSSFKDFLINIPLPIGISFFTFQGISLLVDVYRGNEQTRKNLVAYSIITHSKRILLYKSFFPQLVSGPIVKANDFLPQIAAKYFRDIEWEKCFRLLVKGYFLKMVIADNLKDSTFWMAFPYFQSLHSSTLVMMLFGYSFQIFADFAGYSFIALGLGALFGYRLPENFNFPYIASSFSEFWTRWHISLSSFLREYLYIPLGGNKHGKFRTYLNIMITMLIGGLWHGAAWGFAAWGAYHGLLLVIERIIKTTFKIKPTAAIKFFGWILVFAFWNIGWLFFKFSNFSDIKVYVDAVKLNTAVKYNPIIITYIILYSLPVIAYHLLYLYREKISTKVFRNFEFITYGIMLFMILVNSGSPQPFIYFQF